MSASDGSILRTFMIEGIVDLTVFDRCNFIFLGGVDFGYAVIVITAPLIGAWADAHAAKKRALAVTTLGCIAGTAALYFAGPGDFAIAIAALVISNFFFGTGENLIYGEYLVNAQGEDVVAGIRTPRAIASASAWRSISAMISAGRL